MDSERLDEWLERLLALLVGGAITFAIVGFGAVRLREFLVVEGLLGLALIVWLVRVWTIRGHRLLWPPICWGIVLVVAWATWRWQAADVEYTARGDWLRIITYAALFFVTVNNLHRKGTAQGLAWFLCGIATLLCFYGTWQFVSGSNTVWGLGRGADYVHRASGSYANPNNFAGLLELLLPLAVATVLAGRMKALGRILLIYASLVMLAGLALTFSRGGWLAAGAGMGVVLAVLVRRRDHRWPAVICLAILILGAAALAIENRTLQKRIETSHDLDPGSRNSRPHIWKAALAMWRDHPWFGVGPAHFSERFKQYRTWWVHGEPVYAHNDYLNTLADWGVAGTLVITVPWILLGYGVARTLKQVRRVPGDLEVKRSGRYSFVLGTTAGLIALLVHGLIDFNWQIPANALVAVTWIGLLSGYSRYATDNWWVSSRRPWRLVLTVGIILPLLVAIGWDLGRRGRESLHLNRAARAKAVSDAQLNELKAAWAIEPHNASIAGLIGEWYRRRSFDGLPGYQEAARQAVDWFDAAARVDPYNPVYRFNAGVCLDWLGDHARADPYFAAADRLDPEGRITNYYQGWHAEQKDDLITARDWYTKAITRGWPPYQPAVDALQRVNQRMPPPAPAAHPTADPP